MTQEQILKIITENPGIKMSQIPKLLNVNKASISEQIRALYRKKIIKRTSEKQTWRLWKNGTG